MRFLCTWAGLLLLAPTAVPAQGPSGGNDPLAFVTKGQAQLVKGDANGAIDSFNHALAIDPQDSAAYEGRGEAHLMQSDLADATDDFTKTLQIEPQSEPAFYHRALAKALQGSFDAAIGDLDHAIDLANAAPGESHKLFFERGRVKYFKGDFNGAIADFGHAMELKPDFGAALFFRGLAEEDKGQLDAAAADFAKAAPLGVPEAALWWWEAMMEGHHEDDANAGLAALQSKALAGHPNPWLTELGNFLLQKTTDTQVQADAQSGKAAEHRQTQAWFFLGVSREFSGDAAGARQAYQQAAAGDESTSPLTAEAHRHLKKLSP